MGNCRDEYGEYLDLLTPAEQTDVEEALALTDLGVTCFNCGFGASFARSGQFWYSVNCWVDVMDGGCDYWYDDEQDAVGQAGGVQQ